MKASNVYGKIKAAVKRTERMLALNIPQTVRPYLQTAMESLEEAVKEYERLADEGN